MTTTEPCPTQVLSFLVGQQEFAVDLLSVQEIRVWEGSTQLPRSPAHVEGVMNLRGEVVPILCLRARFGMGELPPAARPIIIVFRAQGKTFGAKVDTVNEVHSIEEENLAPLPEAANPRLERYTLGLVTVEERMLILLDVEQVLDMGERAR